MSSDATASTPPTQVERLTTAERAALNKRRDQLAMTVAVGPLPKPSYAEARLYGLGVDEALDYVNSYDEQEQLDQYAVVCAELSALTTVLDSEAL